MDIEAKYVYCAPDRVVIDPKQVSRHFTEVYSEKRKTERSNGTFLLFRLLLCVTRTLSEWLVFLVSHTRANMKILKLYARSWTSSKKKRDLIFAFMSMQVRMSLD